MNRCWLQVPSRREDTRQKKVISGPKLTAMRAESGLSQHGLAAKIGLKGRATIARIEQSGEASVLVGTIERIATALKTDYPTLLSAIEVDAYPKPESHPSIAGKIGPTTASKNPVAVAFNAVRVLSPKELEKLGAMLTRITAETIARGSRIMDSTPSQAAFPNDDDYNDK